MKTRRFIISLLLLSVFAIAEASIPAKGTVVQVMQNLRWPKFVKTAGGGTAHLTRSAPAMQFSLIEPNEGQKVWILFTGLSDEEKKEI